MMPGQCMVTGDLQITCFHHSRDQFFLSLGVLPHATPFHMLDTVSSSAVVTLYLAIFDFKNCLDLEVGVRDHSRSLKVVPSIR